MTIEDQIQHLHTLRERIAALTETLAQRELSGRLLRLELEAELRQAGATKTAAETEAKAHARYVDHAKLTIQREYDKAVCEAEAEATRFRIQSMLATAALVGTP